MDFCYFGLYMTFGLIDSSVYRKLGLLPNVLHVALRLMLGGGNSLLSLKVSLSDCDSRLLLNLGVYRRVNANLNNLLEKVVLLLVDLQVLLMQADAFTGSMGTALRESDPVFSLRCS